jgi:hypothetical protein
MPPSRGRPVVQAPPGRAPPLKQRGWPRQVDLQPTSYDATNNFILFISIWPPALQHPATEPTQPLSLPPQSLGGTCGGIPSAPTNCGKLMWKTRHQNSPFDWEVGEGGRYACGLAWLIFTTDIVF